MVCDWNEVNTTEQDISLRKSTYSSLSCHTLSSSLLCSGRGKNHAVHEDISVLNMMHNMPFSSPGPKSLDIARLVASRVCGRTSPLHRAPAAASNPHVRIGLMLSRRGNQLQGEPKVKITPLEPVSNAPIQNLIGGTPLTELGLLGRCTIVNTTDNVKPASSIHAGICCCALCSEIAAGPCTTKISPSSWRHLAPRRFSEHSGVDAS